MDDDREPNSVRFWRLNSISALRMTWRPECEAVTPEDLAAIRAARAELRQLEEREKAVRERAARMFARRTGATPHVS